jgi:hypothetical protein
LRSKSKRCEEEYEENHPQQTGACALTSPSLNWESFDKENAPQAFVFDAGIQIEFLFFLSVDHLTQSLAHLQYAPVRDKSPPEV